MSSDAINTILDKYFNGKKLRDVQEPAIDSLIAGKNTLCLMPTGMGKSLIYQVFGILSGNISIIISPLVALMGQQAQILRDLGLKAVSLSDVPSAKIADELRAISFGSEPTFIFISPERAASDGFFEYFIKRNKAAVSLLVIDEAHCVSQWGYTFRPSYAALAAFFDRVFEGKWPKLLALTATINEADKMEIKNSFKIDSIIQSKDILRSNLNLTTEIFAKEELKKGRLTEILNLHRNEKVIVYVHRKYSKEYGTRAMSDEYTSLGFSCDFFDGDMDAPARMAVLERFLSGAIDIVFATSAFGMGIDIPDIRAVVHFLLPESIEQYYQEVGRAGRDTKPAFGYLLYSPTNSKVRFDLIRKSVPTRDDIVSMFLKIKPRKGNLASIHAWNDFSEEKSEGIIWEWFCRKGIVSILGKGPDRIDYFQPVKNTSNPELERYSGVSPVGLILEIASRLSVPCQNIISDIFTALYEKRLKAARVPDQRIYFNIIDEIPEVVLDEISTEIDTRVAYRIEGFKKLQEMIETGQEPASAVLSVLSKS